MSPLESLTKSPAKSPVKSLAKFPVPLRAAALAAGLLLAIPGPALADTASCHGKRAWQQRIVRSAVAAWFTGQPEPEHLIELVQAEHGIAACRAGSGLPGRLHTTQLPADLTPERLGAVLFSRELEWRGLVPAPEQALAGQAFRVEVAPAAEPVPARAHLRLPRAGDREARARSKRRALAPLEPRR